MTEEEWLAEQSMHAMFCELGQLATHRKLRLLACACCRRFSDQLSRSALDGLLVAELYVDGKAKKGELRTGKLSREDRGRLVQAVELATSKHASSGTLQFSLSYAALAAAQRDNTEDDWQAVAAEHRAQLTLLRDIFGNPFRPVTFSPAWRTDTAIALAKQMYESREFSAMPILADALQDAGCDSDEVLSHCRGVGPHVRGCWVVDLVLEK